MGDSVTSAPMRIGVVGTGYVGLTTGACLASLGHVVVCGDIDPRKVEVLAEIQNLGATPRDFVFDVLDFSSCHVTSTAPCCEQVSS